MKGTYCDINIAIATDAQAQSKIALQTNLRISQGGKWQPSDGPSWLAKSSPSLTYTYDRKKYHFARMLTEKLRNDFLGNKG